MASDQRTIAAEPSPKKTARHPRRRTVYLIWKSAPSLFIGSIVVAIITIGALFAPALGPDPIKMDLSNVLESPSSVHPLGTDDLGRDVLSRTLYGARISLLVGVFAVGFALIIGTALGMSSGFFGGAIDHAIMRIMDAILAMPALLLAVAIAAALGPRLENVVIAIGIVYIPAFARLVRAQVLATREEEFVNAARAIGAGNVRIITKHVLPNILAPVIVLASLRVSSAILAEAGLSFLGLGAQPPTPTWGSMVNTGQRYLETAPWVAFGPGVAIFFCILGLSMLGEGVRDIFDPRTQARIGLGR